MSDFRVGIGVVAVFAMVLTSPWAGRAESAAPAPELGAGTSVHAVLESKVDARNVAVGDTVRARTSRAVKSGDRVLLPRGSKLLGRIQMVEAGGEARGESRLGVSFDRAVLPDGNEIAVDLAIQAIAAAETDTDSVPRARGSAFETSRGAASASRGPGGGLIGGTLGDMVGDAPELSERIASDVAIDADASLGRAVQADGTLSTSSQGVIGLRGLQLDSSGKSSVIVRSSGPVTLASGTRLLLRAKGAVSAH